MDPEARSQYQSRALVMKALAHPTRLFLIDQLAKGEACVCVLTARVGADVSTVSKHLALLKQAGIVTDDKRGNQVFYSLRARSVLNWCASVDGVLRDTARRHWQAVGHQRKASARMLAR